MNLFKLFLKTIMQINHVIDDLSHIKSGQKTRYLIKMFLSLFQVKLRRVPQGEQPVGLAFAG